MTPESDSGSENDSDDEPSLLDSVPTLSETPCSDDSNNTIISPETACSDDSNNNTEDLDCIAMESDSNSDLEHDHLQGKEAVESIAPTSSAGDMNSTTTGSSRSDLQHDVQRVAESTSPSSPVTPSSTPSPSYGHKFVIDNIDKNVSPRNMTMESQTRSLHYVQIYSVKDKIDYYGLFKRPFSPSTDLMCLYDILPSPEDYTSIKENFKIIVARLIVEHLPFFSSDFKGLVPRHTPHRFSTEMSVKSEVVRCDI